MQKGLVLLFTLIVLVAMTLAGVALVRSVDTSTIIAGNLAFKQSAEASAAKALEAAAVLLSGTTPIALEGVFNGYSPLSTSKDMTGNRTATTGDDFNWTDASIAQPTARDGAENKATFAIHRLCDSAGPLDPTKCSVVSSDTSSGASYGALMREEPYKGDMSAFKYKGYYAVTVRVDGPRNTVSYAQAIYIR